MVTSDDIQILDRYMQAIGKEPLLREEEEIKLAKEVAKGNLVARDRMLLANLRLVVKIAYNYAGMGVPLIDLISEGNLGLIKAVERFKSNKGGRLITYASWWIRQQVKSALASQSKSVSLPMHIVEKIAKMRATRNRLSEELQRTPTDEELAKALRIGQAKLAQLKSLTTTSASFETAPPFTLPLQETLQDPEAITPLSALIKKTSAEQLHAILDSLEDDREAEIIRKRFGLNGKTPLTLDQIGQQMGLTRERIRQLELSAQVALRRQLQAREDTLSTEEIRQKNKNRARVEVLHQFMVEKGLLKQ